jgi:hypothetical protein
VITIYYPAILIHFEQYNNSFKSKYFQESPKTNNWRKIRGMLHWSHLAKSYKKKVPWVQLAGHQGIARAPPPLLSSPLALAQAMTNAVQYLYHLIHCMWYFFEF